MPFRKEEKHDCDVYKAEIKEMLGRIAKTLDEEKKHFSCVFGTCLGAVRHHDMIPWDNDIDIAVYREDYAATVAVLRRRCPDLYVWEWHQDDNCCLPYARVFFRIDKKVQIERYRAYIDIFIIDGTCDSSIVRHAESMFLKSILATLECKSGLRKHPYERKFSPTILVRTLLLPLFLLNRKCLISLYEFIAHIMRGNRLEVHELHGCGGYSGRAMPSGMLREVRKEMFGSIRVPVPKKADEYLSILYGDWRTPPPENERRFSLATDAEGRWTVPGPHDEDRMLAEIRS